MYKVSRLFKMAVSAAAFVLAAVSFCVTASALNTIDNMDSGEGWDNATAVNGSVIEGKGAIYCTSNELLVTSRIFTSPLDLSSLEDGDVLHVWIYIEDAEKLTGDGQLELTSSGVCDVDEISWSLSKEMFVNGWNELNLSIYNTAQDGADLSAVNFIRFYEFTDGQNSWMIDGLAVGARSEFASSGEAASGTDGEDAGDEETAIENGMGGFVAKNNNTQAGNGPINRYMYYAITVFSVLIIAAVAFIAKSAKKS